MPASREVICNYVTFLARFMQSPDSIRNYVIKTMHTLAGKDTSGFEDIKVNLVLKGVAKHLKHKKKQA